MYAASDDLMATTDTRAGCDGNQPGDVRVIERVVPIQSHEDWSGHQRLEHLIYTRSMGITRDESELLRGLARRRSITAGVGRWVAAWIAIQRRGQTVDTDRLGLIETRVIPRQRRPQWRTAQRAGHRVAGTGPEIALVKDWNVAGPDRGYDRYGCGCSKRVHS